ncbi:MAG: hypothetical protein ACLUJR_04510 [Mediterraneibacter gnavus]
MTYVGNEISVFDREAEQHADEVQKEEGTFWVTYAGTIGTSYDIRTMVLAAEELMKQGKTKIRFQILGRRSDERDAGKSGKRAQDPKCKIYRICAV